MSHTLLRSSQFVRDAKRFLRKHPSLSDDLLQTLQLLQDDPYAAKLKTHKLKGALNIRGHAQALTI